MNNPVKDAYDSYKTSLQAIGGSFLDHVRFFDEQHEECAWYVANGLVMYDFYELHGRVVKFKSIVCIKSVTVVIQSNFNWIQKWKVEV